MKVKFFGMNANGGLPFKVPCESYRFFNPPCCWSMVNTSKGVFDSTSLAEWVAKLIQANLLDVIVELGGTPAWASQNPTYEGYPAAGSAGPPSDLNADGTGANLLWREWCVFIGKFFASHPEIHVAGWCPWNEFTRDADYAGVKSWLGNNAQLVRLAEDARAILTGRGSKIAATSESVADVWKTVGLTAPAYAPKDSYIQAPSTGGWATKKILAYFETPGAAEAAEIFIVHPYGATAQLGLQDCTEFLNTIKPFQNGKPVWATEGSWGSKDLQLQPAEFIAAYMDGLAELVDRFYWYSYDDKNTLLVDANGELTAGGEAYVAAYKKLTAGPTT
jgi:hypothetical protein